jgi:hypothetical protein
MGVRGRGGGQLLVSDEELDAASKIFLFFSSCFLDRFATNMVIIIRLLPRFRLPKGLDFGFLYSIHPTVVIWSFILGSSNV